MGHKCDGCRFKGEHQEMMFRPFGVCLRELNLAEAEKNYNAEKCPYDNVRASHDNTNKMFVAVGRGSDKMTASLEKLANAMLDYKQTIEIIRSHYDG
jgi:hypothetical protein